MEQTQQSVRTTLALAGSVLLGSFLLSLPLTAGANHDVMPDPDEDGFISVAEGAPFYGGIVHSLTTEGGVGTSSALALDRFPVADDDGDYDYERTFTLSGDITDLTDGHIVIHGIDIDESGAYDGEKESSIAPGVPFEATVPAACGVITAEDDDGEYEAEITQLNSTGAYGDAELELDGDQLTIRIEMENVSPEIAHAQHIHVGGDGECPPNTDGVGEGDSNEEEEEEENEEEEDEEEGEDDQPKGPGAERKATALERQIELLERLIERIENRIERLQERLADLY
ncbi:ABC transporter C-terminal domain-containing protein [Candidatus Pacebacteria bacterium]|nr:ABC transporter C-terminal domain-containing protein [Candidatus Paceibacterota bacterium]